jgi:hypothetical protein
MERSRMAKKGALKAVAQTAWTEWACNEAFRVLRQGLEGERRTAAAGDALETDGDGVVFVAPGEAGFALTEPTCHRW